MTDASNYYYSENAIKERFLAQVNEQFLAGTLSPDQRSWLNKVLLQTEDSRTGQPDPMHVCEVLFYRGASNTRKGYFRGAFTLSKGLKDTDTYVLFSLVNGLETFSSWQSLTETYRQHLSNSKAQVMHFLPMDARPHLLKAGDFNVVKQPISGSVFGTTSSLFESERTIDLQNVLGLLSGVPSARTVVIEKLNAQANGALEPNVAENQNRVHNPVADLVFEFFLKGSFSGLHDYEFSRSANSRGIKGKSREVLELEFLRSIGQVSNNLDSQLEASITQYWDSPIYPELSLHECTKHALRDRFMDALMQARHVGSMTENDFNAVYECAMGIESSSVNSATLHLAGVKGDPIPLAGWYCFFIDSHERSLLVMGDQGLKFYRDWFDFTRENLPRFKALRSDTSLKELPLSEASLTRYISFKDRARLAKGLQLNIEFGLRAIDLFAVLASSVRTRMSDDINGLTSFLKNTATQISSYTSQDYASFTHSVLDQASDIRLLINPELLEGAINNRWSSRFSIGETAFETPTEAIEQLKVPLSLVRARLESLRDDIGFFLKGFPTIRTCVKELMQEDWALMGRAGLVDAEALRVIVFSGSQGLNRTPLTSRPMIDVFLENLTGHTSLPDDKTRVTFERVGQVDGKTISLDAAECAALHQLMAEITRDFSQKLDLYLNSFFYSRSPEVDIFTKADRLAIFKSTLIWAGGYYFFSYNDSLGVREASYIAGVQTQRKRAERTTFFYFVPDVYSVVLYSASAGINVNVENCFLITERGGLESECAGHVIFWSPGHKFEVFDTLDACQSALNTRLFDKTDCMTLLNNIEKNALGSVFGHLSELSGEQGALFSFFLIEDDYMDTLSRSFIDQQIREVGVALMEGVTARLSSEGLENTIQSYVERFRESLDVSTIIQQVDTTLFKKALPITLGMATVDEQIEYIRLLERYRDVVRDNHDYLYDIPEINAYALEALKVQLALDFPDLSLTPDEITITLTQVISPGWSAEIAAMGSAVSHETQTLTAFALTGFSQLKGHLKASSTGTTPLPSGIDEHYVKSLVRKLNIGGKYRTLLKQKLHNSGRERVGRCALFYKQLPPHALEAAFRAKLEHTLSDKAYNFIKHVLDMPDAVAREPLNGTLISIRQLKLLASPDSEPDLVKGMYLIAPVSSSDGPFILWTLYAQDFTFKEYTNEASFLIDLRSRETLQQRVLKRLDPQNRKKYDNGGFNEPHIIYIGLDFFSFDVSSTPAPASISNTPIQNNLLLQLYDDNYDLLIDLAEQQALSTEEADWKTFKGLMSLGIDSAMGLVAPFLPAVLNIPFFVAQTLGLLKAGGRAVSKHQWGEAIETFVTAFMLLIPGPKRQPDNRLLPLPESPVLEQVDIDSPLTLPLPEPSPKVDDIVIQKNMFNAKQLAALDAYSENTVSLDAMEHEVSTHLYHSKPRGLYYIVLAGKVFRVTESENRWRIYLGENREGPAVKLNAWQKWELDPRERLLGGGPAYSRHSSGRDVHDYTIQARGIKSIRRLSPDKALMIQMAHQLAMEYLSGAKQTLTAMKALDPQALQYRLWLADYLNMPTLTERQILTVDLAIDLIYTRMSKPSMNPVNSERFLQVKAKRPDDGVVAFIDPNDTHKYVYLTDFFFNTPLDNLNASDHEWLEATLPPFDFNNHYRAVTLIHELSHQKFFTEDIQYMNVAYPFVELLKNNPAFGAVSKQRISDLQRNTLSLTTPRDKLFSRDGSEPPLEASAVERILFVTGTTRLDDARDVFLADPVKRASVILSNADSITLIISRLGGKLDTYLPVQAPTP